MWFTLQDKNETCPILSQYVQLLSLILMNLTLILLLAAIEVTPEQECALFHSKVRKQQWIYFYLKVVLSRRRRLSRWLDSTPPLNPARDHLPTRKWASGGGGHTDSTHPMWASVGLSGSYCTSCPTVIHTLHFPAHMTALMHAVPAL